MRAVLLLMYVVAGIASAAASYAADAGNAGKSALTEPSPDRSAAPDELIARGRYLVQVAGCNDCHTPGWDMSEGKVAEQLWLTGSQLGWRGPWGTTYPSNLRLRLAQMSEEDWLVFARSMRPRPPMPWFNVAILTDEDIRAIYRFVRHLGPAGEPAPAYVPPGQTPGGIFVQFPVPPEANLTDPAP